MKKLLLTIVLVISFVLALAICAFAAEFTVSSADEYKSAFSEAQDGDTIIIKSDLNASLDMGKSITYIIDGGYTWKAGATVSAKGKSVEIYARNGNSSFYPAGGMWCNRYNNAELHVGETDLTFGSLDDSILMFDLGGLVNSNSRLFYGAFPKSITFKSGLEVTNLNNANSSSGDTNYFRCGTLNIYEGVRIYGLKASRPFLDATTINMYGGEITGNVNEYQNGAISFKTLNMYGGTIHDNYQMVTNKGYSVSFLNVDPDGSSVNMYGGEIYNQYVKDNSNKTADAVFGGHYKYNVPLRFIDGKIYNNIIVTSMTVQFEDGIYVETEIVESTENKKLYSRFKTTNYDYSLIFKNADSSVINAYMINSDGTVLKSFDGSTQISIPENELGWTTKMRYCAEVIPDISKQGIYYTKVEHSVFDDYNCETALYCEVCEEIFAEALIHDLCELWEYNDGYSLKGLHTTKCMREGCNHSISEELEPLFINKGYTVDYATDTGFAYSVSINKDAIELYNEKTGENIKYGFIVGLANENNGDIIGADGEEKLDGAIVTDFTDLALDGLEIFTLKLTDINTSEKKARDIFACAYIIDGARISYLAEVETPLAVSVSFDALKNEE